MSKYRGVLNGTITGPPLCRTCHHAHYVQGKSEGEAILMCSGGGHYQNPVRLPFEAYECSHYDDKRLPSLYDMKKQAWLLRTDQSKAIYGFVPPGRMSKAERFAVKDDREVSDQENYDE